MDNVHKKLRSILPAHLTTHGSVSARDAMTQCQEKVFRLMLIDMVMPEVNSVALMNQLRAVQPQAAFVALVLRSAHDPRAELTAAGFSDYLFKPFDPAATAELIGKFFDHGSLLELDSNVMTAAAFEGKEDKVERYYNRLRAAAKEAIEQVAAACYDEAILDLRLAPLRLDRTIRMVIDLDKDARKLGVELRLVGTTEAGLLLRRVIDTASVPLFDSVEHARAMAA